MTKPKDCQGHYIPWICGFCDRKRACKPRELASIRSYNGKGKVRA